jgi:ABC-2 type transport system ATP-binding protein
VQQISCIDLTHSYDGARPAIDGLSLSLRAGEVLALLGPNGAGKSTTLRVLATLQQPDRGQVLWDGVDAWGERHAIRRRIGFLGDGQSLYPTMRAGDYLAFFGECYGLEPPAARRRADALLDRFDLRAKADAAIGTLSKGMRQRLAIARTLVHAPELLLLDEPADGLDPLARRELRDILRAVAGEGVAIVVSSHILRELDGLCDTVAVIQRGKLQVHGGVDEVIERFEVGRRVHELHVSQGLQRALVLLRAREGLVEHVGPVHKPQPGAATFDAAQADEGRVRVRIHGDDQRAAALLRELVLADVGVAGMTRVRSDLEDVYQSLGRDEVG